MTIGVIGCGNMGSALIRGILSKKYVSPRNLVVWDPDAGKVRALRPLRISIASSGSEVACADAVILAVKPQQMQEVVDEIRPCLTRRSLLISIAAGIPTRWFQRRLPRGIPVVRVMPNTPASVMRGISAIAPGRDATSRHLRTAEEIFGCVGEVVRVKEDLIDAVTAVSGSGPAYFFFLMEQMIEEGTALGLPDAVARDLVIETARGAAELASHSKEQPGVLRARVTSKGGTTEAAFKVFARGKLGQVIQAGIRAAARRAKELSS